MPRPKPKSMRCKANNRKGSRCKRRTRKGYYCFTHASKIYGVRVKKSSITEAGLGLFTTRTIKKNKQIVPYKGKVTTVPREKTYTVKLAANKYLDGSDPLSSFGRYANSCTAKSRREKKCKRNNARITTSTRTNSAYLKAAKNRNIKSGEEVFYSYGRDYRI